MSSFAQPLDAASEQLCLVDQNDEIIGNLAKDACHFGAGIRHRAFSLHVMNSRGQFLIQKRSELKMLWPQFWSNSCCSHPRLGETVEEAVKRRAKEELGLAVDPEFRYKFEYREEFRDSGTEHEICHVFLARSDDPPDVHPEEISEFTYIDAGDLTRMISRQGDEFTPWFRMQWKVLSAELPL